MASACQQLIRPGGEPDREINGRDRPILLGMVTEAPRDPEEVDAAGPARGVEIAPETTVGAVHLAVADLARSIDYYTRQIGLTLQSQDPGRAVLGVGGRDLLFLIEEPGASPSGPFTGLYHFALLLPERRDLARWLAHASRDRVELAGMSDHFVSEALYLTDPDGHGIEIYRDRPRGHWEGKVAERMTSLPLDIPDILKELAEPFQEPFLGLPSGTTMGHLHLKVAAIPETVEFYQATLGFGLMARFGDQAAFLAAGGYHHHLGANTWESAGAPPPARDHARLLQATLILPDEAELDRTLERVERAGFKATSADDRTPLVVDPSGNRILLTTA